MARRRRLDDPRRRCRHRRLGSDSGRSGRNRLRRERSLRSGSGGPGRHVVSEGEHQPFGRSLVLRVATGRDVVRAGDTNGAEVDRADRAGALADARPIRADLRHREQPRVREGVESSRKLGLLPRDDLGGDHRRGGVRLSASHHVLGDARRNRSGRRSAQHDRRPEERRRSRGTVRRDALSRDPQHAGRRRAIAP